MNLFRLFHYHLTCFRFPATFRTEPFALFPSYWLVSAYGTFMNHFYLPISDNSYLLKKITEQYLAQVFRQITRLCVDYLYIKIEEDFCKKWLSYRFFIFLLKSLWSMFLIALPAINWSIPTWLKRNFSFLAAIRAGNISHLPLREAASFKSHSFHLA